MAQQAHVQGPGLASLAGVQGLDVVGHLPCTDFLQHSLNPLRPSGDVEALLANPAVLSGAQAALETTTLPKLCVRTNIATRSQTFGTPFRLAQC